MEFHSVPLMSNLHKWNMKFIGIDASRITNMLDYFHTNKHVGRLFNLFTIDLCLSLFFTLNSFYRFEVPTVIERAPNKLHT